MSNNTPKISVIMSVYNCFPFLSESIKSVLVQPLKDFELIIVDDSSTDKSIEIIRKFMEKDKRIKLIKNKKNIGLTKSLNKGLKIAKGKYIARIDTDDISLPNRFQIQYQFMKENPNIFLTGGTAIIIDENEKEIKKYKPITNEGKLKKILKKCNAICHSTIMFKNEKNNFYREKFYYSQDYDFYLKMLSEGKRLLNIPDVLIKYRITPEAISSLQRTKQKLFAEKAKEFYLQRLKTGKDKYESFNPNDILSRLDSTYQYFPDIGTRNELIEKYDIKDKIVLEKEIGPYKFFKFVD